MLVIERRAVLISLVFAYVLLLNPLDSWSQFSPGKLSRFHGQLDGTRNCTRCHELGKRLSGKKCVKCHHLIGERMKSKKGFHGTTRVRTSNCISCHSEHNGLTTALVDWGGPRQKFEHTRVGYELVGKHTHLQCRRCHDPSKIKASSVIAEAGKSLSLSRTFLGLSTKCVDCHGDVHRGQLDTKCTLCHDTFGWKESVKKYFDHARTRFPLVGKHARTACGKCHPRIKGPVKARRENISGKQATISAGVVKYRFKSLKCVTCHKDAHQGKFKKSCEKCHSPYSWRRIRAGKFNHNQTRFPLLGGHEGVKCEKCHGKKSSKTKKIKFDRCDRCHGDRHYGQLVRQGTSLDCISCHTVKRFLPASYSVARHNQESRFVLRGKHRAVPCIFCHKPVPLAQLGISEDTQVETKKVTTRFKMPHEACENCHRDVHHKQFSTVNHRVRCAHCHDEQSWKKLLFDHQKDSSYLLEGAHLKVGCANCHLEPALQKSGNLGRQGTFVGLPHRCPDCHGDPHVGQFTPTSAAEGKSPGNVDCLKCHSKERFKPTLFDHNTMAAFILDGGHIKVACVKCHHRETAANGKTFIRFKPLGKRCEDCHEKRPSLGDHSS